MAERGERCGYATMGIADTPGNAMDPWVAAAVVARVTRKVRVAISVTNRVARHPAVSAAAVESIASLAGGPFSESALSITAPAGRREGGCRSLDADCQSGIGSGPDHGTVGRASSPSHLMTAVAPSADWPGAEPSSLTGLRLSIEKRGRKFGPRPGAALCCCLVASERRNNFASTVCTDKGL